MKTEIEKLAEKFDRLEKKIDAVYLRRDFGNEYVIESMATYREMLVEAAKGILKVYEKWEGVLKEWDKELAKEIDEFKEANNEQH